MQLSGVAIITGLDKGLQLSSVLAFNHCWIVSLRLWLLYSIENEWILSSTCYSWKLTHQIFFQLGHTLISKSPYSQGRILTSNTSPNWKLPTMPEMELLDTRSKEHFISITSPKKLLWLSNGMATTLHRDGNCMCCIDQLGVKHFVVILLCSCVILTWSSIAQFRNLHFAVSPLLYIVYTACWLSATHDGSRPIYMIM